MTTEEIIQKANEVHFESFNYHLTHAFLACDKLLEDESRKIGKEARKALNEKLELAYKEKDIPRATELMKEIHSYKTRKCRLFIDYVNMSDPDAGRVVNAENSLIITLPKKLAEATRNDKGDLLEEPVQKYREILAHELGHVILHTEPLLKILG